MEVAEEHQIIIPPFDKLTGRNNHKTKVPEPVEGPTLYNKPHPLSVIIL